MRLENLPDGGHVKVIWSRERSRDCTGDKASRQRDSKTWWRRTNGTWCIRTTETSWRRTDGTSSLRSHGTSSWHTNKTSWRRTTEAPWWRTTETSLGVSFETCLRRGEDVPLRRLGDVPLRRHWVFHLRLTCDVTVTYRETSLRRRYDVLLPGGRFKSKSAVTLTRYLFIKVAKAFSSATTTSFTLSISLVEFKPLLLEKDLIVFQNFLLSVKSFILSFWK